MGTALSVTLDELYHRHLMLAERADWAYHNLLPWDRGRDFSTSSWEPGQGTLSPAVTSAVETALLTEVNLPWFTAGLVRLMQSAPDALRQFVHTWTAEEDRHARLLDIYLTLSRNGDPDQRSRMVRRVVREGWTVPGDSPFAVMVYTSLQELATRVFYLNLAQVVRTADPALDRILKTVAKDETLHFAFYRGAVHAYLEENPERVGTVCDIIPLFAMPGAGMPDFAQRMRLASDHGGYGLPEFLRQVINPLLRDWGVFDHQVSPGVNDKRAALRDYLGRLERASGRIEQRRLTIAGRLGGASD
jgi:acyl-[acyl-carrier-protein] desaturase